MSRIIWRTPTERRATRTEASIAAASSGVGCFSAIFLIAESILYSGRNISLSGRDRTPPLSFPVLPVEAQEMDQSRRDQIATAHAEQRERAATYRPRIPEIPTHNQCAGVCSHPPPPPPHLATTKESFLDFSVMPAWVTSLVIVVIAIIAVVAVYKGLNKHNYVLKCLQRRPLRTLCAFT